MVDEYTPTTEEVRTDYVMAYADAQSSQLEAQIAFDRWLAAHDAETRRQAAREWADRIYDEWPGGTGHEGLGVQWAEDWLRALAEKGADRGE